MYQSFEDRTHPDDGPRRLAWLRQEMKRDGLAAFMVPCADAHRSSPIAPCDERLAWLTGFSGSAGMAVVLHDQAAVFVDGRYTLQVREQVNVGDFTPIRILDTQPAVWMAARLKEGEAVGFDPWLHTVAEIRGFRGELEPGGVRTIPVSNPIDTIWQDRPDLPKNPMHVHPEKLAGRSANAKIVEILVALGKNGPANLILTLPDSICWLLNIRGSDIPHTPAVRAFAILNRNGELALFTDAAVDADVLAHLGGRVRLHPYVDFPDFLARAKGDTFRLDPASAPFAVAEILGIAESGTDIGATEDHDPCILPKARKNATELAGAARAHSRDAAAMAEFLAWLDRTVPEGTLTEIDVVERLEEFRRSTNALSEIAFDTICGAGPNGAIPHYRVSRKGNRAVRPGELLLIDSGGQYRDGTTDITRTVCTGNTGMEEKSWFTRVLQGLIAMSRAHWPKGLAGRDLDAMARMPLWLAGQDYDHGTGHGVGAYLGVHEGPAALSRSCDVPLEPGMILSIEPGYYRAGAFGVRIENLAVVEPMSALPESDVREMLCFRTLTHVPIDRRLIRPEMLTQAECDWLNGYHRRTLELLGDLVSRSCREWLEAACAPLPDAHGPFRDGG